MGKVKYRFYLDYEKEENWVNDMAKNGWHLMKFAFGKFTFQKGDPGAFVYRNECILGMSSKERKDYLELLKASGVTIVHEFGGWIYMKKAVTDGSFELYTDTKSKMAYYTRILNIFFMFFLVNLFWGISNISFLSDASKIEFINSGIGILNILVAMLIAIPLIKVIRRKRNLRDKNRLFE